MSAPRGGRRTKPENEKLVANGIHMHPSSKRNMTEIVAFRGTTQREFVEEYVARLYAQMLGDPLYSRWVAAGRPIPIREWKAAGCPDTWDGKVLQTPPIV